MVSVLNRALMVYISGGRWVVGKFRNIPSAEKKRESRRQTLKKWVINGLRLLLHMFISSVFIEPICYIDFLPRKVQ